ncbi:hypothetical protein [Halobacillus sp. A5]|uniref:hypothetical protein n=1 Tax=Halobacillus sp. A5 TaxID=2880263 RepID=UPI0020A67B13|nr:hypothetical protein [Halobacillus sp. A5]MCP3026453.1 hypothetical protein [Halobacillus sp. A5]
MADNKSTEDELNIENNLSPTFTSNGFELTGEEGRFGMWDPANEPKDILEFKANNQVTLYEFYFWGEEEELVGETHRLVATNENTREQKTFQERLIETNQNEEIPAQALSAGRVSFNEGETGSWLFKVYVDGKVHSSFSIDVKD